MLHHFDLSLFLFSCMGKVFKVTLPCVFPDIPPSHFLEIEEARNSLPSIYRITTWIRNGTKQFLEIGIRGNDFVWFNCFCWSIQVDRESLLLAVTVLPLQPDSVIGQGANKERDVEMPAINCVISSENTFYTRFAFHFGKSKPSWRTSKFSRKKSIPFFSPNSEYCN